jgi:hypothetical protein
LFGKGPAVVLREVAGLALDLNGLAPMASMGSTSLCRPDDLLPQKDNSLTANVSTEDRQADYVARPFAAQRVPCVEHARLAQCGDPSNAACKNYDLSQAR